MTLSIGVACGSNLIVNGRSVGDINIGDSLTTICNKYGEPNSIDKSSGGTYNVYYYTYNISMTMDKHNILIGIVLTNKSYKDSFGLYVGAPANTLTQCYGMYDERMGNTYIWYKYGIAFAVEKNAIRQIIVFDVNKASLFWDL